MIETPTQPEHPWVWPRAAYIHIPFCASRCGYCDFAIAVGQDHRMEEYLAALECEIQRLGEPQPVDTVFLGGGTPTHLPADALSRLFALLGRWLPLRPGGEWSIEANPDTLDEGRLAALTAGGVTRVSLGVQSFQGELLRLLDRSHPADAVPGVVNRLHGAGLMVSVDLIFGTPGQTLAGWREDLRRALDLGVQHISTYGLTYEKGTPLWKQRRRGEVRPLDEEAELALYETAIETLEAAGFEHYEVSNFARPGFRCRHNEVYWANEAYFGFGMGAARYVRGVREINARDLETYLRKTLAGEPATFQSEELVPWERARETMAVQLRRSAGIERRRFREQTGYGLEEVAGERLGALVEQGVLADAEGCVRLSRRGWAVADGVVERLL